MLVSSLAPFSSALRSPALAFARSPLSLARVPLNVLNARSRSFSSAVLAHPSAAPEPKYPPHPPRSPGAPAGFTVKHQNPPSVSPSSEPSSTSSTSSTAASSSSSSSSATHSGPGAKHGKRKTGAATVFGFLFGFLTSGALGYYYLMEDVNKSARSLRRKMDELQRTTEKVALSLQRISTIERELQSLRNSAASAEELRSLRYDFDSKSHDLEVSLAKHKQEVYATHQAVFQLLDKRGVRSPSSSTAAPSEPEPAAAAPQAATEQAATEGVSATAAAEQK